MSKSKLDDILTGLDSYLPFNLDRKGDKTRKAEAKAQIKELILELVGEDEWAYDDYSNKIKPRKNCGMWGRNKLRKQLREKIEKL